jgi:hypothetical protein
MNESNWVVAAEYGSPIIADMYVAILENAGIPVLVKGPITGAFGPGFGGVTPEGVTVLVPVGQIDAARELISVPPSTDESPEAP